MSLSGAGITSCPTRSPAPPSFFHLNGPSNIPCRHCLTSSHPPTPPVLYLGAALKSPYPSPSLLGGAQQLQGAEQSATGGDGAVGTSAGAEEGPHWAVLGRDHWKEDGDICPCQKTHQQAPKTEFVTDLSCCQGKIQLSASQHSVPGCRGSPLASRSGQVRGERAAARERGAPPRGPSQHAAHHPHLRPPHQPPDPHGIQQTGFPTGVCRELGWGGGQWWVRENPLSLERICSALRGKAACAARPVK